MPLRRELRSSDKSPRGSPRNDVFDHWNGSSGRRHHRRLSDGKGKFKSAGPAGRTGHHRRRGAWHIAHSQSASGHDQDDQNDSGVLGGDKFNKARYTDTLKMLNDLFSRGRKGGISSLEPDVEAPDKSEVFKKYDFVMKDHHVLDFICDTLRMAMTGTVSHFDLDQMIELDLEVHHHEVGAPIAALSTVADCSAWSWHRGSGFGRGDHHGRHRWSTRGNRP